LDRIRPLSRVSLWNEQGEKLDIESEREKRIKILEAELASLEFAVVESVRTVIPRLCHSLSPVFVALRAAFRIPVLRFCVFADAYDYAILPLRVVELVQLTLLYKQSTILLGVYALGK